MGNVDGMALVVTGASVLGTVLNVVGKDGGRLPGDRSDFVTRDLCPYFRN